MMIENSIKPRRPQTTKGSRRSPRNYAKWRVATLVGVYLLFVLHFVHWKLAGRTLAPLELNEVMYTLELGIVTAGFLFMVVAMLATVVFGRFFCSWGCHILALEDLAAWLLEKVRIHPKPIRSRVLRWVPFGAMVYMFVWPQVSRQLAGTPMPALHLQTDSQGWASFLTTNFWRNLPGPGVTVATFLVCGFLIVYMLGTRGFCTYACPYGALFRIADRFAPGRIVAAGDCSRCGKCTAVCQSHVLVHRELVAFGRVVDPACLKDLDCVAACPEGVVQYGIGKPAFLTIGATNKVARPRYDFSAGEEAFVAATFVGTLLIFRGLYNLLPFLLTLALGGILSYGMVMFARHFSRRELRFNNVTLKSANRFTRAGWCYCAGSVLIIALTGHSAFIRYHEFQGMRFAEQATMAGVALGSAENRLRLQAGIGHLEFCNSWGLVSSSEQLEKLGELHGRLATVHANSNDLSVALNHLQRATTLRPDHAPTHYNYGVILAASGRKAEAIHEYRRSLSLDPSDAEVHNNLGYVLADAGEFGGAIGHLSQAIQLQPRYAPPYFNLGRIFLSMGRRAEALKLLNTASKLDSSYTPYISELLGIDSHDGGSDYRPGQSGRSP